MKQNGVRLVQRKFAQGVPIPASSVSVAPTPPERRPEPPYPPRNVYHSNLTARGLLDMVSMQNIHRHTQEPLVVLERIQTHKLPPPVPEVRVKKRRVKNKNNNNNNMCLRSGKRKAPDAAKGVPKKRKKLSSESTDDVPLLYYFNRPKRAGKKVRSLLRGKRNLRKRRGREETRVSERSHSTVAGSSKKSDDRGFTFKEPSSPARLSNRLIKKKPIPRPVRELRKTVVPLSARLSGLRSARVSEPLLVRPLRNTVLLGKSPLKPAAKKHSRTVTQDENPPLMPPPSVLAPRPPASDRNSIASSIRDSQDSFINNTGIRVMAPSPASSATVDVVRTPSPSPRVIFDTRPPADGQPDWCIENADYSLASDLSDMIKNLPDWRISPGISEDNAEESIDLKPIYEAIDIGEPTVSKKANVSGKATEIDNRKTTKTIVGENSRAVQKDKSKKVNKNSEIPINEQFNIDAERRTNNLDAENRLTDNFDAEIRPEISLGPVNEQRQSMDVDLENLDAGRLTNTLNAEIRPEGSLGAGNEHRQSMDVDLGNLDADRPINSLGAGNELRQSQGQRPYVDLGNRKEMRVESRTRDGGKSRGAIPKKIVEKNANKEKNKSRKPAQKPAQKPTQKETKKSKPKRGAKTVPEEAPTSTRLLRNSREPQPAPNPDVYEFDAELEASRPPSSLRWRTQAAPDVAQPASDPAQPPTQPPAQPPAQPPVQSAPVQYAPAKPAPVQPATRPTSPESVEYFDILPNSSHCIEIRANKQQESGAECVSVKLVPKDEIKKKKNLIENLSNSPALLNKFFDCLTAELKTELDNLIAAEGLNEPSTSTSKQETFYNQNAGSVFEAPTFYPTAEEFQDPIKYVDKIAPQASIYGLCKIVPPEGFKPPCNMSNTVRFAVMYQYISKMYNRWGPVYRELAAIKAHLRTQSVVFARSPLLDGSEVNLSKFFNVVERLGGLSTVMQRKRWARVAEEMKLTKLQHPERKLDPIYMRYLLPYATLSDQERQNIMAEVEKHWTKKYQKMLERARHPFQRQNRMLGTEGETESDDDVDENTAGALHEAEDCIVQGRVMNQVTFKKIATSLMDAHFDPKQQPPSAVDVENAYWRAVLLGTEHIVANTASIDTGEEGYGFPKDPEAEYGTSPWNLKVLAKNPNNVLRYLGPVLGVTVPTLHLSMLFSTSCWHRDPHGLPWIEYMHSGADKIWYGIPRDESANFRRAVETLCPAYCQNKPIWLASEITMVPPNILSEHGVKLSRLVQRPGEYVLVFPEAHSCSITTGFGISESVYFASNAWLAGVYKLFQELRNSCEPTMFSLEQLLLNGSADPGAPQHVCLVLCTLLSSELEHRRSLELKGLKVQERPASSAPLNTSYFRAWNARDQDECEYCRSTLFLSKVTGLTPRKTSVCSEHALRLLETKKHKNVDLTELEFISSHSTSALEEMLERLESRTSEEAISRAPSVIDLTGPERHESQEQDIAASIDLSE